MADAEPGDRGRHSGDVTPGVRPDETTTQGGDSAPVRVFRTRHALVYVERATGDQDQRRAYLQRPGEGWVTEEITLAADTVDALDELALGSATVPRWRSPFWVADLRVES